MTAYAQRRDVYKYGLARGALGSNARLVDSALAATDVVTLDNHGFETDDILIFRATEGGNLPAPLSAGTTYFAIRLTDATFQVAATQGGSAIDLTTDAVSTLVAIDLPFDDVLEFYSRWVDHFIPAHAVPFTAPYPVTVVAIVAELAAKKLQQIAGQTSVSVGEYELAAKAQLERFAMGLPLRDASATAATNKTVTATLVATGLDPRGWGSGVLP